MATPPSASMPAPHGGALTDLMLSETDAEAAKHEASTLSHLTLDAEQIGLLELLISGALSPLRGYMDRATCASVVEHWRLPDGLVWPLPVVLTVSQALGEDLAAGQRIALRDPEGVNLAILDLEAKWPAEHNPFERAGAGSVCLAGPVTGLEFPVRYGFESCYRTPAEWRATSGQAPVLVVHTCEPLHRPHIEQIKRLAAQHGATAILQPDDGGCDIDSLERVALLRSYRASAAEGLGTDTLALAPRANTGAVERERVLHAIIGQNQGAAFVTYFDGREASEAEQTKASSLGAELDTTMLIPSGAHYDLASAQFHFIDRDGADALPGEAVPGEAVPGAADVARMLRTGDEVPAWLSYPGVIDALRDAYRAPARQGMVIFFTGLSGSGKSTIARYVFGRLVEDGSRPTTLLDGDVVRQHLSSELGFSKAHRDLNIRRIGYVAAEIAKNGGAAVCAPIAPYAATRAAVRAMVERNGTFIEVHVATPLEVCEARDRKGLYALARAGKIPEFTGISDPYEVPDRPALRIDTTEMSAIEAGNQVLAALREGGFIA